MQKAKFIQETSTYWCIRSQMRAHTHTHTEREREREKPCA